MSTQAVIHHIEKQISTTPKHRVYVIEIESIPFTKITTELQIYLESFPQLQYLSINNCSLTSLENFPKLTSLIRLDLISNNLVKDFQNLNSSKYLQTLYLSANQISEFEDLESLKSLLNLLQLDLIANPITSKPDYNEQIFKRLPWLKFLDSKDKYGKESNESNMSESLKRIRPDLFIKGESLQNLKNFQDSPNTVIKNDNLNIKPKKTEKIAIKQTNSYKNRKKSSVSSKSGLVFPVSRIRRQLKKKGVAERYSKKGIIFLTAVLQYMCAEILEVAGKKTKEEKGKRIMPRHLLKGIRFDRELQDFFQEAIIPEAEFFSKLKL